MEFASFENICRKFQVTATDISSFLKSYSNGNHDFMHFLLDSGLLTFASNFYLQMIISKSHQKPSSEIEAAIFEIGTYLKSDLEREKETSRESLFKSKCKECGKTRFFTAEDIEYYTKEKIKSYCKQCDHEDCVVIITPNNQEVA